MLCNTATNKDGSTSPHLDRMPDCSGVSVLHQVQLDCQAKTANCVCISSDIRKRCTGGVSFSVRYFLATACKFGRCHYENTPIKHPWRCHIAESAYTKRENALQVT